jgi:HK97 family phage major capsid protein
MTKLAIPQSSSELEEMLLDKGKVDTLYKDGQLAEVVAKYVTVSAKDKTINEQAEIQAQRMAAELFRNLGYDSPDKINLGKMDLPKNALYNRHAPGVKIDDIYKGDHRKFLQDIYHKNRSSEAAEAQAKMLGIMNSFGSNIPSDGGFLVPETLRSELLQVMLETSIVRPRARTVPMDSATVPFPAIDSTTNAGSVFGGIAFAWAAEGEDLSALETSTKFMQILLKAAKFAGYTAVPNELFQDSIISMMGLLDSLFPLAAAFQEDIAHFHGNGVGQPLGFLNSGNTAKVAVTAQTAQGASTLVYQNFTKMFSRMLPSSLGKAVWLAHIDTFPELAELALSVGTGGGPMWITNMSGDRPMTIFGRPLIFTEKANTLGTEGDVSFVDLGYYLIGDRMSLTMSTSTHSLFANDKTAVRWISRQDGRPWLKNAITPAKGSNTLTPFVTLSSTRT